MIKILLILITFFAFTNSFSQVIVLNPIKNSNPYGSALCGENILIKVDFPKTNESVYLDSKKILSDTLKSYISINYYLKKNAGKVATQTADSSILNSYITKLYTNPKWQVFHYFYLDTLLINTYSVDFNPFATCYTYKYNCDDVSVMRHKLILGCSTLVDITKTYSQLNNDTINMIFSDSTKQMGVKCAASIFLKVVDTAKINRLKPLYYTINVKLIEDPFIVCVKEPCIRTKTYSNFILNKADLSKCIPTVVEDSELNTTEMYPNPANDNIYITSKPDIIQLIDIYGQKHSIKGSGSYDLLELKAGMYLLQYEVKNQTVNKKLIIK